MTDYLGILLTCLASRCDSLTPCSETGQRLAIGIRVSCSGRTVNPELLELGQSRVAVASPRSLRKETLCEPQSHGMTSKIDEPAEPVAALTTSRPEALEALSQAADAAASYVRDARAARTREEYQKHWDAFVVWCDEHGLCELPAAPETLALYLAARADSGLKCEARFCSKP